MPRYEIAAMPAPISAEVVALLVARKVDEDGLAAGSGAGDQNAAEGKPADKATAFLAMSTPMASSKPAVH